MTYSYVFSADKLDQTTAKFNHSAVLIHHSYLQG